MVYVKVASMAVVWAFPVVEMKAVERVVLMVALKDTCLADRMDESTVSRMAEMMASAVAAWWVEK